MPALIGKAHDLILNGGAISGTHAFNNSREHRRTIEVFLNDPVRLVVGVGQVAGDLWKGDSFGAGRKARRWVVAWLLLQRRKVNAVPVEAGRGSSLEPTDLKPKFSHAVGEMFGRRLTRASGRKMIQADMD